jgi:hypothetical protein
MSKFPAPTADQINEAHALARTTAETAVQHAHKCGQLLAKKKAALPRGEFDGWVAQWCDFGRSSAYAYLKLAANSSSALDDWKSINQALGYEQKPKQGRAPAEQKAPVSALPVSDEPEWDTHIPAPVARVQTEEKHPVIAPPDEPAPDLWEDDDADLLARTEAEITESIDKVMASDDRLAAAYVEIKRQAAEIAALKISRDGLQNRCGELVRMLKKEQATVARLRSAK